MADVTDVEAALVGLIAQAVYPDGTAAASATGTPARVFRGWPVPQNLTADLKAGIVDISVFPLDIERNLTRNPLDWIEQPQPPVYLTLTVAGSTITVGGRVTCPLNAAVTVGSAMFAYPLQATDTPTSVATALANQIPGATSVGPVITVPGGKSIAAAVGTVGNVVQEIRRQVRSFRISLWCPNPAVRDAMAAVVDAALANVAFVNLPDGTAGRLLYARSHTDDGGQKAGCYRRDLVYTVEYSTTNVTTAAEIVSSVANVNQ